MCDCQHTCYTTQIYGSATSGRAEDSIVTLSATWELFKTHNALVNMSVPIAPGWPDPADTKIRFQDICYRNQLDACGFSGCV
jgi:hypothetical protein